MTTLEMTKTQHVKNIISAYPTMPAKDVASRANCDVALVNNVRKGFEVKPTLKPKATPTPTSEVSIKKACEVLLSLSKDIEGLDILLFQPAIIRLDYEGDAFECTPDEVESVVKAIKLLKKHTQ